MNTDKNLEKKVLGQNINGTSELPAMNMILDEIYRQDTHFNDNSCDGEHSDFKKPIYNKPGTRLLRYEHTNTKTSTVINEDEEEVKTVEDEDTGISHSYRDNCSETYTDESSYSDYSDMSR